VANDIEVETRRIANSRNYEKRGQGFRAAIGNAAIPEPRADQMTVLNDCEEAKAP
jgi:hypothetical protein